MFKLTLLYDSVVFHFLLQAPRILLINQQANAEGNELMPLPDVYNYQNHLRTPPSIKNQKLYFKGRSPGNQYRGYGSSLSANLLFIILNFYDQLSFILQICNWIIDF